ncbi:MAG: nucleoside deaminase [Proteobacteria bacterium]|nr:nucleoside deaminase [Pseudomonadota bacterium]
MALAMKEAEKAYKKAEVPVGAVIIKDDKVVSRGHNTKETTDDPTAHAEILTLKRAAKKLGAWRLTDTTLYVTLEPCLMCMGAIVQARVTRLVFATMDPKAGACGSLYDIGADKRLNHLVDVTRGVMQAEASGILKMFFKELREKPNGGNCGI